MTAIRAQCWTLVVGVAALGIAVAQQPGAATQPPATKTMVPATNLYAALDLLGDERKPILPTRVSVDFEDAKLSEVFKRLAKDWNVNFYLDEAGIAGSTFGGSKPIWLSLKNVDARTVLKTILEPMQLSYEIRDDVVVINDREAIRRSYSGKYFPVADVALTQVADKYVNRSDALVKLLVEELDRDIWEVNGGDATIAFDELTLSLVVNAPEDTLEKIDAFLRTLRRQQKRTEALLAENGRPALRELRTKLVDPPISQRTRDLLQIASAPPAPDTAGAAPPPSDAADRALKEATEARQIAEKALRLALKLEAEMQAKKK